MILLALLLTLPLHAQPTAFEVSSVKPHLQGSGVIPLSCANGRLVSMGFRLNYVIEWAYNLNGDQSRDMDEKLPGWISQSDGVYDIEAKSPTPVPESQCRLMLQALLADRFHFAAHWESKAVQVYDLVVARSGPKLPKASATDPGPGFNITLNGRPMLTAPKGQTMQQFADFLTTMDRHKPVTDKTGLEGIYKIDLKISLPPAGSTEVFLDPDLETALQQQLGLKLEGHKGAIQILLPDHIDRPTPN